MKLRTKSTIEQHFSEIEDPRVDRSKRHLLIDIITLTLCAVIGGAETWEEIELYGNYKYKWFKKFLKLPNGIPSHDTKTSCICSTRSRTTTKMFSRLGQIN